MVFYLIVSGIIALVVGTLLLFSPQTLRDSSAKANRIINKAIVSIDEMVYRLRVGFGALLILASLAIFLAIYLRVI